MRKIALWFLLLFAFVRGADTSFWQQLTEEERQAAGVATLSPAQQAALDRLAERYAREGARQAVETVRTEIRAQEKARLEKHDEEQFGHEDKRGGPEAIRTRIAGEFRGWTGRTLFRLENGQVWVQADPSDRYNVRPQPGPEVEIRKAAFGGWKLFVMPHERFVRVRRVE